MKENQVEKFRNRNLTDKISIASGLLLVVCLWIMVTISVVLASSFLKKSINGEFDGIVQQNGITVQAILNTAESTAKDLQNYIVRMYEQRETQGNGTATSKSEVYDVALQQTSKQIEEYALNTAWSVVATNEDIAGIGVFFEPDAFDPAKKDYTIYVSNEDAQNHTVQSYGDYSSYGSQDYYTEAASTKQAVFTKPYDDQGIMMVTASYPIVYNNELKGIIVVDINVDNFSKLKSTDEKYPSMYVDVLTADSTFVYDSESKEYVGTTLRDAIGEKEFAKIEAKMQNGESFSVITRKDSGEKVARYFTPITAGNETWWAASALAQKELNKNATILVLVMILTSVITVIIIVVIMRLLIRKYIKPIDKVVEVAEKLSDGDFSATVSAVYHDEIGQLSDTFGVMSKRVGDSIRDITRAMNEMSKGNFNIRPEVENYGDIKQIEAGIITILQNLSHTLLEIGQASDMVADGSGQIAGGAQALTEGATEQSSSIQELQAVIADVSDKVETNAKNAKTATAMAHNVGEAILLSNEQMQEVVAAMDVITETSVQIKSIIDTIDEIASQTNLLALNASIEAARAGEAGRGFTVVATQVGTLANGSAEAARNSTELISKAIEAVENGKKIVDAAAEKLVSSVEQTNKLVENIDRISAASEEQASALTRVTDATSQIAAVIQENTAMAEESAASSEELAAQAEKLKSLIDAFTLLES